MNTEIKLDHGLKLLATSMHSYANYLHRVIDADRTLGEVQLYDFLENLSDHFDFIMTNFYPAEKLQHPEDISRYLKNIIIDYKAVDLTFKEAFGKELVACYRDEHGCLVLTSEKDMHEALRKRVIVLITTVLEYNDNFKDTALFAKDPEFLSNQLSELRNEK